MLSRRAVALSLPAIAISAGAARAQDQAQTLGAAPFRANHPQYAEALALLTGRRWRDLIALVSALPPQSAMTLLDDLGRGAPLADDLNALARTRGGRGVAGGILVGWAWRYRGATMEIANDEAFSRMLLQALEHLGEASRREPNDGVALAFCFTALKAVGEKDVLQAVLQQYLSASRRPVGGLANYSDAISAKWVGSEEEALAFGRRYANSAPAASYGLIAEVHVTTVVARTMSDDAQTVASTNTYFQRPDVVAEIVAAHDSFLAAPADADTFATHLAHAQFSFAFVQMGDLARARQHLAAQGDFTGGGWRYNNDPYAALQQARGALGLTGA